MIRTRKEGMTAKACVCLIACALLCRLLLTVLHRQLTRLDNLDLALRPVAAIGLLGLDLSHHLHRIVSKHLSEHNVLAVEPRRGHCRDEELGTVGILASIRHGQLPGASVLELEILVLELVTIDALSSGAVTTGEISALEHEVLDDPVENRALVSKAFLSRSKRPEVLRSLRDTLTVQPHGNTPSLLATDCDVKEHLLGNLWPLFLLSVRI
mmetsp:Transcript_17525/g.35154  ORF Transcript_17525/g.35154 Transcript_17525/m.35154 type:complete len:211 (-) Transcript_17525:121-753(-)